MVEKIYALVSHFTTTWLQGTEFFNSLLFLWDFSLVIHEHMHNMQKDLAKKKKLWLKTSLPLETGKS